MIFSLNRYGAFGFHILGSLVIVSCAAICIFFIWYPGLLAYASGVGAIFLILVLVDVVLGPLITLIVFDKNKKELKRDLLTIVILQIVALLYGMWVMFSVRPLYVVFNSDRFDVVYANELSLQQYQNAKIEEFKSPPFLGPIFIGARLPDDTEQAAEIIKSAIEGGNDVQQMPEFYLPYSQMSSDISSKLRPLSDLRKFNKQQLSKVDALINQYLSISDKIGYIPLRAKVKDLTVIINKETSAIVEMNKLQPLDNSFGVNSINLEQILKKH